MLEQYKVTDVIQGYDYPQYQLTNIRTGKEISNVSPFDVGTGLLVMGALVNIDLESELVSSQPAMD